MAHPCFKIKQKNTKNSKKHLSLASTPSPVEMILHVVTQVNIITYKARKKLSLSIECIEIWPQLTHWILKAIWIEFYTICNLSDFRSFESALCHLATDWTHIKKKKKNQTITLDSIQGLVLR